MSNQIEELRAHGKVYTSLPYNYVNNGDVEHYTSIIQVEENEYHLYMGDRLSKIVKSLEVVIVF